MKKNKYLILLITTLLSTAQLKTSSFFHNHKIPLISATAIIGALGYTAYLQINNTIPCSIPHANNSNIKSIVFDIDGVLSTTNKLRAFQEIGLTTTLWEIIDQQTLPSEKMLFNALSGVPAVSTYPSYNKGLQMPQIMIDWQSGAQSLPKIQESITNHLATSHLPESIKDWVLQSTIMMMDPTSFIATRQTIPENIKMLHELKNKGYKLYILSNWDPTSFALFKTTFPEIFTHNNTQTFDGIMISGNIGIVKPEIKMFTKCLSDFNLKPDQTLFIDDEPANIASAQQVNMHTVLANPNDTEAVQEHIIELLQN